MHISRESLAPIRGAAKLFSTVLISALAGAVANGMLGWFGGIVTTKDLNDLRAKAAEFDKVKKQLGDLEHSKTLAQRTFDLEVARAACVEQNGLETRARVGLQAAFEQTLRGTKQARLDEIWNASGRAWTKWDGLPPGLPSQDAATRSLEFARTTR